MLRELIGIRRDPARADRGGECSSRWIALAALEGAISSEVLYAPASDYESQINQIVPALLFNCLKVPIPELRDV